MSWPTVNTVRDRAGVGGSRLLLLMVLASRMNPRTGLAMPSLACLAKDCRLTARQVARLLNDLEGRGLVRRLRGKGIVGQGGVTTAYTFEGTLWYGACQLPLPLAPAIPQGVTSRRRPAAEAVTSRAKEAMTFLQEAVTSGCHTKEVLKEKEKEAGGSSPAAEIDRLRAGAMLADLQRRVRESGTVNFPRFKRIAREIGSDWSPRRIALLHFMARRGGIQDPEARQWLNRAASQWRIRKHEKTR